MNIKRAKEEIEHTVKAYLAKDALGEYAIPAIRQRPILLMGPPGKMCIRDSEHLDLGQAGLEGSDIGHILAVLHLIHQFFVGGVLGVLARCV